MFLAEERNQSLLNNYNPVLGRNTRYRLETRNKNWLKRLKEYKFNPEDIAEKECNLLEIVNLIFAVGLNHLPGEFGLLQMLKKEGYEVEPCLDWNLMQEPMPIKEQNKTITATLSSWFKDFKEVVYRLTNAKKELLNLCDIYSDKLENIPAETQITDEQKDALRKMEQNMYKINKHLKACGFNKEESSRAVIKENMHKVRNLIGDGKKSQAKVKDFGLCG